MEMPGCFFRSCLTQGRMLLICSLLTSLSWGSMSSAANFQNATEGNEFVMPAKIAKELSSQDEIVRSGAVFDARDEIRRHSKGGAQRAINMIAEKLKDSSSYVRGAAASSLRDLGSLSLPAKDPLMEVIRSYPNSDASVSAIEALGSFESLGVDFQRELEWYLPLTKALSGVSTALNVLRQCASEPLRPETILYIEGVLERDQGNLLVVNAALRCISKLSPSSKVLLKHLEAYANSDLIMRQFVVVECIRDNPKAFQKSDKEKVLAPLRNSKYFEVSSAAKNLSDGNN